MGVKERLVLSDVQWERISGLIIGRPDQKGSTGRNNRMFVEGVLWIIRTGSPWRQQSVPDIARAPGQVVACGFGPAGRVEQTHLDAGGVEGEQREVDALLVPRCTQGPWRTCVNYFQITGLTDHMRSAYSRTLRSLEK